MIWYKGGFWVNFNEMIWYKVSRHYYSNEKQIQRVEVIKSTKKNITIKEGTQEIRVNKSSDYDNYFETYEQAYSYLLNRKEKLVEMYSDRLSYAKKDLEMFLREY